MNVPAGLILGWKVGPWPRELGQKMPETFIPSSGWSSLDKSVDGRQRSAPSACNNLTSKDYAKVFPKLFPEILWILQISKCPLTAGT